MPLVLSWLEWSDSSSSSCLMLKDLSFQFLSQICLYRRDAVIYGYAFTLLMTALDYLCHVNMIECPALALPYPP